MTAPKKKPTRKPTPATAKKPKNSRAKGKKYERLVAKHLGDWWGEPFRSTPGSGALHWEADNRVAGDIVPPVDSTFPFTVECKNREGWYFDALINETGEVADWWTQSVNDARRVDRIPLLVFTRNFAPNYAMLEWDLFEALGLNAGPYLHTRLQTEIGPFDVGICPLTALMAVTQEEIIEKCK